VKPGEDLPDPLPPGAHRVISTLAAAQMRKMMEGVVLFGTGKSAQLNGYSSGGKTGTAQKIDPATHTYSKTMHIASFAGFAPVNNPVIAVAVVLDSPKGAYYGADVSAPVFAEVAQQVLEYLGVPHDIDLRPADHRLQKRPPVKEDDAGAGREYSGPLRCRQRSAQRRSAARTRPLRQTHNRRRLPRLPVPMRALNPARRPATGPSPPSQAAMRIRCESASPPANTVVVADAGQLRVPSLLGLFGATGD
jgi:cell division protein FtsI (penicillin-binding protein 3)